MVQFNGIMTYEYMNTYLPKKIGITEHSMWNMKYRIRNTAVQHNSMNITSEHKPSKRHREYGTRNWTAVNPKSNNFIVSMLSNYMIVSCYSRFFVAHLPIYWGQKIPRFSMWQRKKKERRVKGHVQYSEIIHPLKKREA